MVELINKIREMKCYCKLCALLKLQVLECKDDKEAIKLIQNYDGFQCGAIQDMRFMTYDKI